MRVCFPVAKDFGMESAIAGHFGSAPCFVVVDLATGEVTSISNEAEGGGGGCKAVVGLRGAGVDSVVVGGIGRGALQKLHDAGMRVYQAEDGPVADNVILLRANRLREFEPGHTCGGHGHGHGDGHGHGSGCSH